ncbi:MAG: alpha/beta hydrolase-fold protein [Saprospiraceae bacterium]
MKYILFLVILSISINCRQIVKEEAKKIVPGQVPRGKIKRIDSFQSSFVDPRKIDIWTPGDFDATKKYSVIYMQDGQMLFDSTTTWNKQEWQVDETMDKLLQEHKIHDAIIVGIWNNNEYRSAEYVPEIALKYFPNALKADLEKNYFKSKPRSNDYLRFIVYELKTFIDSSYPTYKDPQHTFIMGSSKGGLISLYAICVYPQIFGGAGCLSTDWVLTVPQSKEEQAKFNIPPTFIKYLAENLPDPKNHRIYFDYGTETLDHYYEPFQIQVDSLMVKNGYTSENWMTKKFTGEDHSEHAWARRLHMPLEFLIGVSSE